MKLFDGRGKRFEKLIDLKLIMKENRLAISEVIPGHARAEWYWIWIRGSIWFVLAMSLLFILGDIVNFVLQRESFLRPDEALEYLWKIVYLGFFVGGLCVLTEGKRTWKSKAVAIRTLAAQGFCPNCGYIIRGTPAESDGCTPCSECGHAWRVEPVES